MLKIGGIYKITDTVFFIIIETTKKYIYGFNVEYLGGCTSNAIINNFIAIDRTYGFCNLDDFSSIYQDDFKHDGYLGMMSIHNLEYLKKCFKETMLSKTMY